MLVLFLLVSYAIRVHCENVDYFHEDSKLSLDQIATEIHPLKSEQIDREEQIKLTLEHYRQCRERGWACKKECRLSFRKQTGNCRHPNPGDNCFGIPITHSYSDDFSSDFPYEFAVLSRYPRCWSYLGPLICATVFRPCAIHSFFEKGRGGVVVNGTIELWQLLRGGSCRRAQHMCSDVISAGFFPPFINCISDIDNYFLHSNESLLERRLYSNSCQLSDQQLKAVPAGECPWPLTRVAPSFHDSKALFDECYLPCKSSLISPGLSGRFNTARLILCSIFIVMFMTEAIYLSMFSKIYTHSLIVFCITHALFSISLYYSIWALSFFDNVAALSECSADGLVRKAADDHNLFEWCVTQSLILYWAFMAAFLWLFIHFLLSAMPPSVKIDDLELLRHVHMRPFLLTTIYGISAMVSILFMWTNMRENDGISGVCHIGIITWWRYCLTVCTLLLIAIPLLAYGFWAKLKRNEWLKAYAKERAINIVNSVDEATRAKRREKIRSRGFDGYIPMEMLRNVSDDEESMSGGESCMKNSEITNSVEVPLLNVEEMVEFNCEDMFQGIIPKERTSRIFIREYIRARDFAAAIMCRRWRYSMWELWTFATLILTIIFLLCAPTVHFFYVASSPNAENDHILGYVRCGISHIITNRSAEWLSDEIMNSTVSLSNIFSRNLRISDVDSPWCSLPTDWAQARLNGVVLVFLLLPALPFFVFTVAFAAGVNNIGVMEKVRELRPSITSISRENIQMNWMRNNAMCESALSTTTVDFRRSRVDSKKDPICLQKSELADDGTYHSSSAISLVNGERERFASTERVAQSAPSPVPSDAASDPPEGSGRKGRVRKINMMERMRSHKESRRIRSRSASLSDCERLGAVGLDEYGQSGCFTKQDQIKLRKVADVIQGRRMVEGREIPANLSLQDTGANSVDRSAESSMLVMTNAIYTAASREGQLKERHRRLIEVTSGLRDELHFQQAMLTSDSAAWTLCMIFNRRLEHCLSVFDPDVSLNSHIDRNLQGIRDLRDELAMVLPMLSEHTQQLGRWFTSVQDAFRNLDLILNAQPTGQNTKPLGQNIYTNSSNQRSVIVSQDLKRQEKLLAFQNYFLAQRREGDPPSDVPSFLHPSPLQLEEYTRKYFTQNVSTHRPGPSGISVYDVSRPIFDQQREQCGDVMAESKQKVFPPTHHQTAMENSRFPNTSIGIQRAPALFHRPSFHSAEILRGNNSEMIPQGFPGFVFKPPSVNGIESNVPPTSGIQLSSSGTGENQFVKSEDHQRLIIRFPSQQQQLQQQQLQQQQLQQQQLQQQQLQQQQLQQQQLQQQQLQQQQLHQQQVQQQQVQQQQVQQQQQPQQQQLQQQQGIPVVASIERPVPPAERPAHELSAPSQASPRINAYVITYSAAPRGFTSKLSVPAIRLRIQQLRNICADDRLYPQELTYMLLLTGDLGYGANRPLDDGETFYTPDRMPDLFGDDVPDIDARIEPRQFFIMMRRRAIIVAGAIGYHFRHFAGGDINYNPPILPRLSMDRPRNELILRRVLGDSAMPCLYALLRAYNNGDGPISHRPQLDLILAFTTYLDNVALREGFQNDHKVEFIPDPLPSGRGQVGRLGGDDYILEDHEEQNNGDVEDDSEEEEDDENNESEESEVDAPPPVAP